MKRLNAENRTLTIIDNFRFLQCDGAAFVVMRAGARLIDDYT